MTEPDSYFTERQSVKDTKIYELEDQIAELLPKNKKLEEEVSLLEEKWKLYCFHLKISKQTLHF